jgi:hypothetical protein
MKMNNTYKPLFVLVCMAMFVCGPSLIGQTTATISSVPVVNGKVVFEQFLPAEQTDNASQRYIKLQDWAKKTFTGNPLLLGIRFDDKAQSVTVSSKAEILLPANTSGGQEKMIMSYRFDATITNAGCLLVVRDITYQPAKKDSGSFFPKIYPAEETITDQAVATSSNEREMRVNLRKETLRLVNKLNSDLSQAL